jgi:glycosyltransferase involved in cell wall biosynthesis
MPAGEPKKLLVLIPALNEEATVGAVVQAAQRQLHCDVLVIDDGSTDATAAKANSAGAYVLRHPFNLGVGAAIRSGLRYAAREMYPVVVQLDADGQHDPAEAERLLAALDSGADLAVGSRFADGYEAGHVRRWMMRRLAKTVSRRVKSEVHDATSGFRAFSSRAVGTLAGVYPTAYLSDTVEALLLAANFGLSIAEVEIKMHPRQGGRPSSGSIRSAIYLLRVWLVILLHPVRARPPGAEMAGR